MVIKVYVSGISGNKEVKKRQQRVLMILDSRNFKYDLVDIAEPDNEAEKDFMQVNSTSLGATVGDTKPRHPLPPQIFNDMTYCGDYDQFDMANEIDELEKFLKLAPDDSAPIVTSSAELQLGPSLADQALENAIGDSNEAEAMEESNEAEAAEPDSALNGDANEENEKEEEAPAEEDE